MGLFTQEKTDYSVPIELRMYEDAKKSQRQFTDTYLDPAIKENIGYESPRMKMKALTKDVDLTDGKAVQKVFMELQSIDPEQAEGWLQSIKPVITQHLDSIKIKTAQLKFTKTKNKPLIKQRWSLLGRPNFMEVYATTNLAGLEGHADLVAALQGAPANKKSFIMNAFLNKIPEEADGKAHRANYKSQLKEAETIFMDTWLSKETLDSPVPTGDERNTGPLKLTPAPTAPAYYTPDGGTSQIAQDLAAQRASVGLRDELYAIRASFYTLMPEFLMTDAELAKEDLDDEVGDWIASGEARTHFTSRPPKALAKFKANPVEYYQTVIKAK